MTERTDHGALVMQVETERVFARSVRHAFREWPENAVGIDGPPEPLPSLPLLARLLQRLLNRPERTGP